MSDTESKIPEDLKHEEDWDFNHEEDCPCFGDVVEHSIDCKDCTCERCPHCGHPVLLHDEEFGHCNALGNNAAGWPECECKGGYSEEGQMKNTESSQSELEEWRKEGPRLHRVIAERVAERDLLQAKLSDAQAEIENLKREVAWRDFEQARISDIAHDYGSFGEIKKALGTEMTMHAAWRKRAEESEAAMKGLREALQELVAFETLCWAGPERDRGLRQAIKQARAALAESEGAK